MHTSACFKIVNKYTISKFARFKFKDFSRIFTYFQAPYLFSSTFKGLEVFIPNSSITSRISQARYDQPWRAHLQNYTFHDRSSPNCEHTLPMAVARSSSGGVAIRYVLPVLWPTPYLPIMGSTDWGMSISIQHQRCRIAEAALQIPRDALHLAAAGNHGSAHTRSL